MERRKSLSHLLVVAHLWWLLLEVCLCPLRLVLIPLLIQLSLPIPEFALNFAPLACFQWSLQDQANFHFAGSSLAFAVEVMFLTLVCFPEQFLGHYVHVRPILIHFHLPLSLLLVPPLPLGPYSQPNATPILQIIFPFALIRVIHTFLPIYQTHFYFLQ